jgi:hypothetical protein
VALGRMPGHRLQFSKLKKPKREAAAAGIANLPVAIITNVIVSKNRMGEPGPAGDLSYVSEPDNMYLWALRLLLERVSWFVAAKGCEAKITFSHVQRLDLHGRLGEYRAALEAKRGDPEMQIRWKVFEGHPFVVESPKSVEMLQVPDTTASSTYHAVQPGADGPAYLQALRPKLYRGVPPLNVAGPITTYGLKVFPDPESHPGGGLDWLRSY